MIIDKFRVAFSNAFRMQTLIENKLIVSVLQQKALCSHENGIVETLCTDKPIVVSLTTYGKKIHEVYLVIESIFQQTLKPNKIVLWLSEKDFSIETLPVVLKRQMERGLEIRLCKDVRSYTKVVYAFKEFAGCHIISIDDDIVYPFDMIEQFVTAYRKNNRSVLFNKGHEMLLDKTKKCMLPYIEWCRAGEAKGKSLLYLPLGVYGIFYPDGIMSQEVTNEKVFMDICPMADDVWFKAMTLKEGIECASVDKGGSYMNNFISIELNREKALARTNVDLGANDWQIQKVFDLYGLFDMLNNEKHS